jgi:hypothetical protein
VTALVQTKRLLDGSGYANGTREIITALWNFESAELYYIGISDS